MYLSTQEFLVYSCSFAEYIDRQRSLLLRSGWWILRCQLRSNGGTVHISKFSVKKSFLVLGGVSDGGFVPASLLFSAACLNTTVKHAVFAVFTLGRGRSGLGRAKFTSSGLQAGICREI